MDDIGIDEGAFDSVSVREGRRQEMGGIQTLYGDKVENIHFDSIGEYKSEYVSIIFEEGE